MFEMEADPVTRVDAEVPDADIVYAMRLLTGGPEASCCGQVWQHCGSQLLEDGCTTRHEFFHPCHPSDREPRHSWIHTFVLTEVGQRTLSGYRVSTGGGDAPSPLIA